MNRFSFRNYILIALLVLAALGIGIHLVQKNKWQFISSDGVGYYSYLPTLFIYNTTDMKPFVDHYQANVDGSIPYNWAGITQNPTTGVYTQKYTLGTAILSSPFFLVADFLTNLTNTPRDGLSFYYQLFSYISTLFYFTIGSLFLYKVLKKYFKSEKLILLTLIVITFGTNFFHYLTNETSFSHTYSFALIAVLLYEVLYFRNKVNLKRSALIGLTIGIIALIRPTNVFVALLTIPYFLGQVNSIKEILNKERILNIILAGIFSLIAFLPQIVYWKITTGSFLTFSYVGEYFDFLHPQVGNVLFSIVKGLFFWTPVLLFTIYGFYKIWKDKYELRFLLPLVFIIQIYLVSSWWAWSYGDSYGHRAFIDFFGILAIPLGFSILSLKNLLKNKKILASIFIGIFGFFIFLNLFQAQQYWQGLINHNGETWEDYSKIFLNPCIRQIEFLTCPKLSFTPELGKSN